jgi:hypothetical protein
MGNGLILAIGPSVPVHAALASKPDPDLVTIQNQSMEETFVQAIRRRSGFVKFRFVQVRYC